VVYVCRGHNSCPDTGAQLYTGRAGGSNFVHRGGGGNSAMKFAL